MKHTLIHRILRRCALLGAAFALAAFTGAQAAPVYTDLHDFANTPDGTLPLAGVRFDANDNIYGTTFYGGATGLGILFKIGTDGAYTIVHDFGTAGDGQSPESQPTIDQSTGDIYGTTTGGGAHGYGTIWKVAGDGTYTVLYSLDGVNDGAGPLAPMLRDRLGNLYGTALQTVGKSAGGTVFKFSSDGVFTVLHAFTGPDGLAPEGTIVRDRAGNLYGTTFFGGDFNAGVVYKVAPDGTYTKLYSFTGGADGLYPVGGVDKDQAGNIYGTTFFGGTAGVGNVWKLAPDGTFTTLYSFTGGADGAYPEGDVLRVGKHLYGYTVNGGTNDGGVIWRLRLDGTEETVLHSFIGPEGLNPATGQMTVHHEVLYGHTPSGGASGNGVVFSQTKK